jgi:DNA segregation ATPase FtsK/SpoIIIE, S-DNA-T family
MRKTFMSNDYLPSALRVEDAAAERMHEGGAAPFPSSNNSPDPNWEEPWLATGQAEPGWWQAFAIDHGVRSTRTPDKFIRKPQETNVFDLPTGELMQEDRLAELAMNTPEDEIHKRIERLRAAMEAPPVKTFTQKTEAAVQPASASPVEQARAADLPGHGEPPPASEAHDVEIPVSEIVETVSQPLPETLMTFLPTPSMMFVPSAFQSALYRIDVSLKHSLLTLADTVADEREVPEAPLAATTVEACDSDAMEADAIVPDGHPEPEVYEGTAAGFMKSQCCDGCMAASQELDQDHGETEDRTDTGFDDRSEVADPAGIKDGILEIVTSGHADEATELMQAVESTVPEATDIQEEEVDLGYLALYGENITPTQTEQRAEAKVALRCAPDTPASEEVAVVEEPASILEIASSEDKLVPEGAPSEHVLEEEHPELDAAAPVEVIEAGQVIRLGEVMIPSQDSEMAAPRVEAVTRSQVIMLPPPVAPQRARFACYQLPSIDLLAEPPMREGQELTEDILEERAGRVEKVIRDFGVKGEVIHVHPGPVVTLYELEPAPGVKSSRVIALSEDIARSMSAVSARVAVIPGRNAIGIELPNEARETVYLREMLETADFTASAQKLPICLGKTIGGEPVIADLARMPHLLVAGTTGSGKSVAINTMILSLLYRFTPEQCRLIMVDPKMLELSVYDGIPHLLTPVVTDPKKAIIALRWAVREMEERYKKMARLGVRNIDGFNARIAEAKAKGEVITRTIQTGFDKATGELTYTEEVMDLTSLPYIVVIVDEMADLMMVAGKEIEGAIQRLAQMARAAGIHVILATQRPSVDVITGTIKANFPTRISFQVTSKIDSRTILGEMGAEQLLGQGDMLHMQGGGRIARVHGPFVSDIEVERIVAHLKRQAKPVYVEAVTAEEDEEMEPEEAPVFDEGEMGLGSGELFDQAVSIVLRHKKASTSYIQRRLQIGYNRAASIMERMEKEGIVGPANHAGKREILIGTSGADED